MYVFFFPLYFFTTFNLLLIYLLKYRNPTVTKKKMITFIHNMKPIIGFQELLHYMLRFWNTNQQVKL